VNPDAMTHFYESLFADDAARPIAAGCFVLTVALYFVSKRVYARFHQPWLTPLLTVPVVLVAIVLGARIPYPVYFADTRWLMWLLGPATVAFAVPIFEYRHLLKKHWLSLSVGVTVGILVAVGGSLTLAKLLHLSPELQRSLATRSVSTPFALAVSDKLHAPKDLTALFVIATGVVGMLFGEIVLALVPLRSRLARGALFGAAAHGVGTAKARELGSEEGVVASLTMMIAGVAMVLLAPLLTFLPF
jgi:predicted murein hydrolase (TIGR00659 family)